MSSTDPTTEETLLKHKEFLLGAIANYYTDPLVLTDGDGLRVTDREGRTYLDFFGGILTVSLGQCNEHVNSAVKAQLDRIGHVSTLYPTLPIVELALSLIHI